MNKVLANVYLTCWPYPLRVLRQKAYLFDLQMGEWHWHNAQKQHNQTPYCLWHPWMHLQTKNAPFKIVRITHSVNASLNNFHLQAQLIHTKLNSCIAKNIWIGSTTTSILLNNVCDLKCSTNFVISFFFFVKANFVISLTVKHLY